MKKYPLCQACETVSHCSTNGCIPVIQPEPPFPGDAASWGAYAVVVLLFTLVVFLPLYFNAL